MTAIPCTSINSVESATDAFLEMSNYLTGCSVEPDLAGTYLERVRVEQFGVRIDDLLQLFAQLKANSPNLGADVRTQIIDSPDFGLLAQQVILLWYTSAFAEADRWKFSTPEQYFRAHIWNVIGAHPPALSGGYFGYWKYPPEN